MSSGRFGPFHPPSPDKPGTPPGPPAKPANFTAGNFPAVTHDQSVSQAVIGILMTVDATLTGSVTQTGPAIFKVTGIAVDDLELVTLQASQLPPSLQGMAGQQVWQQVPAGSSNGSTPIAVKAGQFVYLNVTVDVPEGAIPPGGITGVATLGGGAAFSQTVLLTGTYLGVNVNSPIGKKWAAMGGEAKLGPAQTNEETSPNGAGTVQVFANGTLYDYKTSSKFVMHGTDVVYFLSAPVWAKWLTLGQQKDAFGTAVWLAIGLPKADTGATFEGGQVQQFENGDIVVRSNGAAWAVYGAIFAKYLQSSDPANAAVAPEFGYPISDEVAVTDPYNAPWRASHFDAADVFWSNAMGAHEIHGPIRDHFLTQGLGYPTSDVITNADNAGSHSTLQNGVIYYTQAIGAFVVYGDILVRWAALGYETSYLGYPVSDEEDWTAPPPYGPGRISNFQFGQIGWRSADRMIFEFPNAFQTKTVAVTTPDGTALGGTVSMLLKSNGDYTFECHMHDSGLPSYDFTVRAVFISGAGQVVAAQHSGHVEGTDATTPTHAPNRDDDYTESGNSPLMQANWAAGNFPGGTLYVTKDYSATGLIGFVEDVTKAILDIAVGAVSLSIGIVISIGREIGQIFNNLGEGMIAGVFAGVVVCVFTGGFAFAVLSGVAVGGVIDTMIQQRPINDEEYAFVDVVFQGKLPAASDIMLTNLTGLNGTAFTVPGVDQKTYINLGDAYNDPLNYFTGSTSYPAKGQVLVHELTHVWQIKHRQITSMIVCEGIVTQTNKQVGQSVYQYGPPTTAWGDFNLEAQGAIVDQWFGGIAVVNAPLRYENWVSAPLPPPPVRPLPENDPYFGYIANNIRKGQT